MYDSSTGRTLESFRHVELPTILSEQDGCEDVDLGPPPVSDAVQRAFNGLDLALAAARNAEDLCESRLRVLTWVILFEQSAGRHFPRLTALKERVALTAIQAAKQFSFGDLLGSYRSPELGEDKEKIRFSPRYIEACTRQGRVASSVGTALAVGGSGAVSIVGALLLLTSAGPLGLGLFAGGLLGMGVLGFPATIVPLGWMYGKRDQELQNWEDAIRRCGTDSMGSEVYPIDGIPTVLSWHQRHNLIEEMFTLAEPRAAKREGYSLLDLAVKWYACRENFPTFLDRIRIEFAQSDEFWDLTELEAASLAYGTERGLGDFEMSI